MNERIEEYFLAHLTEDPSGCLLWSGPLHSKGYGLLSFQVNGVKTQILAHRYAWTRVHGPIPESVLIDHRCHVHPCVRVDHLRPATQKQNQENRKGPNRNNTSSGVRNVRWNASGRTWTARVKHHGKAYHAGGFATVAEAEQAAVALRERLFTHL
jgi:hypothetical protein